MLSSMATLTGGEAGVELVDEAAAGCSGFWIPRKASALICGDVPGVREAWGLPAARNRGGGHVTCSGGSKGNPRVWRGVEG